jgi:hypothetical protein
MSVAWFVRELPEHTAVDHACPRAEAAVQAVHRRLIRKPRRAGALASGEERGSRDVLVLMLGVIGRVVSVLRQH